jgi:predicted  nucleic acid-binding Zn-ribbon protein
MHPQLELLLELQDLNTQRKSLAEDGLSEVESTVFDLQPADALELLDTKIEELAERLDAPVRDRFSEVSQSLGRAVAPVLNGICYGCFVAIPTAWSSEVGRNDRINVCDHCGRFLYYVD